MQAIKCEMCNSSNIVKDGDFFVCQSCGTKYTLESARKLMGDAPVSVTVDNTGNFEKYVSLAREAMCDALYDVAYDNFTKALEIEPANAECVLGQGVAVYGKNTDDTIPPSALKCVEKSVRLFKTVPDGDDKDATVMMYIEQINAICKTVRKPLVDEISSLRSNINHTSYTGWNGGEGQAAIANESIANHNANIQIKINKLAAKRDAYDNFKEEAVKLLYDAMSVNGRFSIMWLGYIDGNYENENKELVEMYPSVTLTKEKQKELLDKDHITTYNRFGVGYRKNPGFIKMYLAMGGDINIKSSTGKTVWHDDIRYGYLTSVETLQELINNGAEMNFDYGMLSTKTDPSIRVFLLSKYPEAQGKVQEIKKSGCYVATCVYGSYDCPQVWTLRRFRDYTLAKTWYGRAFIRTYYAISPTLVKWFGKTSWFKKMWQNKLDRMVRRLNDEGVGDTPYQDKIW